MKATPIAEYLQRKAARGARGRAAGAARVRPRRVGAANDDREPDFRRSGLVAALARRSPERRRWCVRSTLRSRRAASRRRLAASRPAARARGRPGGQARRSLPSRRPGGPRRRQGRGRHRARARARGIAEARRHREARLPDERIRAACPRRSPAASPKSSGASREAAARVLKPLLVEEVAKQIVDELAENVARLTRGGGVEPAEDQRARSRCSSALKTKVESLAVDVEYVEEDGDRNFRRRAGHRNPLRARRRGRG